MDIITSASVVHGYKGMHPYNALKAEEQILDSGNLGVFTIYKYNNNIYILSLPTVAMLSGNLGVFWQS